MLVRCEEPCHMRKWLTLSPDYCAPMRAVAFWLRVCKHIPEIYVYRCTCGKELVSGPAIAREMGWDEFTLAQNDILWILDHTKRCERIYVA